MVLEQKVVPLKTKTLNDLIRLAAATAGPQGMTYILKFHDEKGRLVLGVLGVFRDYYKYYGVPMFYYYVVDDSIRENVEDSNYIIVSTGEERIEFSKHPKPGLSIPLIHLASKPAFIPELD